MEIVTSGVENARELDAVIDSVAAEGIYLAHDTGFGEQETRKFIEYCLRGGYPQLLAIEDGRIVGWCDVVPGARRSRGCLGLGVLKEYRGRGFGKQLLAAALAAGFRVFRSIELSVRADNARAIALYRAFGFCEYRPLMPQRTQSRGRVIRMRCKR